jgi:hypothetical protein
MTRQSARDQEWAHNPKVAGSNPAPATIWKARKHCVSGPSAISGLVVVYRVRQVYRLVEPECCELVVRVRDPVDAYRPASCRCVDGRFGLVTRCGDHVGEVEGGGGAHAGNEVLVGGHGESRVGVAESF